jgi:receptor protein-tyrosine kinase
MAMGGMDVALVSGDLRRPSLEATLDVPNNRGLTDFLSGAIDQPYEVTLDEYAGLTFLPAGQPTANPGELLGSNRFKRLIAGLEETHDIVIIDTSPIGVTADAAGAATAADGVLMVVDGRRTDTSDLLNIRDEFRSTGTSVVGAVLNRDASRSGGLFRRRYGYYASDTSAQGGGSGRSPKDPVAADR